MTAKVRRLLRARLGFGVGMRQGSRASVELFGRSKTGAFRPGGGGSRVLGGGPTRAGGNSRGAPIVQASASVISRPMLDVPGSRASHRLPKAVAVVMPLNTTARVRLD